MKRLNYLMLCLAVMLCISCQGNLGERSNRLFFRVSMTRGAAITTDSFNAVGQTFNLNAYLEENGRGESPEAAGDKNKPRYISDATFTYVSSSAHWSTTDEGCTWRNQVYTNFWAYAPVTLAHGTRTLTHCCEPTGTCTDPQQKTMSFTYTMPEPAIDSLDAEKLPDMIFGYARKKFNLSTYSGSQNVVNIGFRHAVSAVQFKKGNIKSGYDIRSIKISGFNTSGKCTMTGVPSAEENANDTIAFAWSDLEGASSNTGYIQKINLSEMPTTDATAMQGEKIFMVIPQELTSNAVVSVDFVKTSDGTIETKAATLWRVTGVTWEPGKKYFYKINFDGNGLSLDLMIDAWGEGGSYTPEF